ncbi:MAG TPA: FAD-binding oxidoreductase [Rubrobacter sp.]|nr:FAD-binding oxidoreductase [Rubrobacter sp.]
MTVYDVVVIGGGNLGLWTAHRLVHRGFGRIAVLERGWAGGGATSRSAGVVRQQGGSATAAKLGKLSRELYLRLGDELGLDSGFMETGYYIVAETEEEKEGYLRLVEVRRAAGVENEWVEPGEGRMRFPDLNWDRFVGATYTPDDGYVHPPVAARNATSAVLGDDGVDLFEMCEVSGVDQKGDRYTVESVRGTFDAERVVDAGGPRGAREIGRMVGVEVPVMAVRHQVVSFPYVPEGVEHPFPLVFNVGKGYYWRPEEQGVLLGMSNPVDQADETGRYQIDFDWNYYEGLRPDWESAHPALEGLPVSRAWAASIDYTPDHLPIIDEPVEGFYVLAAGGHGMMWGPALGEKMAELISEGAVEDLPEEDIELARFSRERDPDRVEDTIALPFPKK